MPVSSTVLLELTEHVHHCNCASLQLALPGMWTMTSQTQRQKGCMWDGRKPEEIDREREIKVDKEITRERERRKREERERERGREIERERGGGGRGREKDYKEIVTGQQHYVAAHGVTCDGTSRWGQMTDCNYSFQCALQSVMARKSASHRLVAIVLADFVQPHSKVKS